MSRSATVSDEMQPLHARGPVLARAGLCVPEAPLRQGYPRLVSEAVIFYLHQGQLWDAQIFCAGSVSDGHCERARR